LLFAEGRVLFRTTVIRHLYFHIPFCPKLCPYCSFYVETGSAHRTQAFLDAILTEVDAAARTWSIRPETIFFGGGTPSALRAEQLIYLCDGLRARLDVSEVREWTLEANPSTIGREKAEAIRECGVSRLSLGVQAWDDEILRTLGRTHTAADAEATFDLLRQTGFDNVNIDLMFAVPGQSLEQWRATLARTIALAPEHISTYCLTFEEDTDFFRKLTQGVFAQDETRDAAYFEVAMEHLGAAGYRHYEISNHARAGCESIHNKAYWHGTDYLGFGPSAFSTVQDRRWQNVCDTAAYIANLRAEKSIETFSETLTPRVRRNERVAFGLRTIDGISLDTVESSPEVVREFQDLGLIENRAGRITLTTRGKLMADAVAEAFIEM
jgi:oxygen-independent coproporphyrinogen-3 oxidase